MPKSEDKSGVAAQRSVLLAFSESRCDNGFDSTAHVKVTDHFHPFRFARRREIVENAVYGALVEDSVVPIAPEIQLQALELETHFRGNVGDVNRSEVGRTASQLLELFRICL